MSLRSSYNIHQDLHLFLFLRCIIATLTSLWLGGGISTLSSSIGFRTKALAHPAALLPSFHSHLCRKKLRALSLVYTLNLLIEFSSVIPTSVYLDFLTLTLFPVPLPAPEKSSLFPSLLSIVRDNFSRSG